MTALSILKRPGKPDLAYVYTPGSSPVMFLGGYRSDMSGTKATYLEARCAERGQGFLRFDYSGHGQSGGKFVDGTIGSWKQDALDVMDHVIKGDVILIGSSMGGWISLLMALERKNINAMIGIAAAPDFTLTVEKMMSDAQRLEMAERGFIAEENDYDPEPYIFTRNLLDDARRHLLLDKKHKINAKIRLLQGGNDADVPLETAFAIQKAFAGDVKVTVIDDGDHRLSRPQDLELIDQTLIGLC